MLGQNLSASFRWRNELGDGLSCGRFCLGAVDQPLVMGLWADLVAQAQYRQERPAQTRANLGHGIAFHVLYLPVLPSL